MNITFIGLGRMGKAMVRRLLQANYNVTVFNRTFSKQEEMANLGAKTSQSIAQAVANADVVLSCLLDDNAVLSVSREMLPHLKPNVIHMSLATILPDTAKLLQQMHTEKGAIYVSGVVLGVPTVADKGGLTAFYAGQVSDHEKIEAVLKTFSAHVIYLGEDIHASNVMKICLNYSLVTAIELISEVYAFAEKSGLDTVIVQQALHEIYGHPAFKRYIDKIHDRNFDDVNFNMLGGNKDVALFQEAFSKVGVAPELANVAKSRFTDALAQGMQEKDWSAIYEIIRKDAGLNQ